MEWLRGRETPADIGEHHACNRLLVLGLSLPLTLTLPLVRGRAKGGRAQVPTNLERRPARIGRLINQLGADSFHRAASRHARIWRRSVRRPWKHLRKAMSRGDLRNVGRAAELIRTIEEEGADRRAAAALKKVHLKLQDVPVLQAVDKLAKLSGYVLRVDGDRTVLAGKTVTLDTGEVTFWEALDRLSARAGLVEKLTAGAALAGRSQRRLYRSLVLWGDPCATKGLREETSDSAAATVAADAVAGEGEAGQRGTPTASTSYWPTRKRRATTRLGSR